jgi:phosphatidylglycerol lysyltransferase
MKQHRFSHLSTLLGVFLLAVALWMLHTDLQGARYREVVHALGALPLRCLFLATVLTAANYLVLTWYDALALWYIHYPLAYGKIAFASFIGYALSNNLLIAGGAARLRLYGAWGLSAVEVTGVVTFCIVTFCLGLFATGGVLFLVEPLALPPALRLPGGSACLVGVLFLVLVSGYLVWSAIRQRPLTIWGWEFPPPALWLSVAQILVSSLDWVLAGSVCYVLLPPAVTLSALEFFGIFLLGRLAGVISQVPGGLGVFEAVALLLLSPWGSTSAVVGSLIVYRGIYYLLPLSIAALLLGTHEVLLRKGGVKRFARLFGYWVPALAPHVLAVTTFVSGAMLLFSGATPAVHSRLAWLNDFLPLPVLELSHFLGSLAGVGLLLLARGVQQRLDVAYHLTVLLLSTGIVFSLLKGFDYEEAIALALMLGALLPCRPHFYRKASLLTQRFSPRWTVAVLLVLAASVWLGIFSHQHVEYAQDRWWRFAPAEDAPRFLRATVGTVSVTLFFALARLLSAGPPEPVRPGLLAVERARAIVKQSRTPAANLALLGDKALLFSESGTAFIMYGVEGHSWVVLGDPVGAPEEKTELVWRFRELCDRHGGWPVFYEVGPDNLPLYLDLGLSLLKFGEAARVRLADFSLDGSAHKEFRYVHNRLEKAGCTFAVIAAEHVPAVLPELKQISDAWLQEKHTREKGFSLGFFEPDYLSQFPAAVVHRAGTIVAFANLWLGADKEELSPDLIRYLPQAPPSVMEYLLIHLMLWGKHEGYHWFSLGMAPLSGLEAHALAPLWSKLGAFVFRHGEHFYNFHGVRQFKEKFDPVWEPRYLASPGGLALPRIVTNLATLIAGGLKGVIMK